MGTTTPADRTPAGGGSEDRFACRCSDEALAAQNGVPEVRIRIAMREIETRQGPGQVRRQVAQFRQVEDELRYRTRLAVSPKGLLQAVGLGGNVVDHDDRRGLRIAGRGPTTVQLVFPAFVHRRLDRTA